MSLDREAARARCRAATEGPWGLTGTRTEEPGEALWASSVQYPARSGASPYRWVTCAFLTDATFIAHARTDLPAALDELDAKDTDADLAVGIIEAQQYELDAKEARLAEYVHLADELVDDVEERDETIRKLREAMVAIQTNVDYWNAGSGLRIGELARQALSDTEGTLDD